MLAVSGHGGTYGAAGAVALCGSLLAAVIVLQSSPPPAAATLLVYEGDTRVATGAGAPFAHASSGQPVLGGQSVHTGDRTKASLTYPNKAQVRLDSNTNLRVNNISRLPSGGLLADAYQSIGKTWTAMSGLAAGSTYAIHAPNSTTAEVRGTEFEVIVEIVNGQTVVRINVFSGMVAVTADGVTILLVAGESTTIVSGSPPTPAAPISQSDRLDSFTVFNQTLDQAEGTPQSFGDGHLSPPQSTGLIDGPYADGRSDLQFLLGWPGSEFQLDVFAPDGALYGSDSTNAPPVTIKVSKAAAGQWKYRVTDVQSRPGEAWWVIVSSIPSSASAGVPPPAPPSGGPAQTPGGSSGTIVPITPPGSNGGTTGGGITSSGSAAPPPPPPPPPPATTSVEVRGDGSIAAGVQAAGTQCHSATDGSVRFKLRADYAESDGSAANGSASLRLDFATTDSCTPGAAGARDYEVTSGTFAKESRTGDTTVLVLTAPTMTDVTKPGKGSKPVACTGFVIRVTIIGGGNGPRSSEIGFEILDSGGGDWWAATTGSLLTGSLTIG